MEQSERLMKFLEKRDLAAMSAVEEMIIAAAGSRLKKYLLGIESEMKNLNFAAAFEKLQEMMAAIKADHKT